MAIKPVEIELLIKDGITPGINKANSATERLAQSAEEMADTMTASIKNADKQVEVLEEQIKSLEKQLKKTKPGTVYEELKRQLDAAKQSVSEEKQKLEELSESHEQAAKTAKTLMAEKRALSNAVGRESLEGKSLEDMRELLERAGEVYDTMGDVDAVIKVLGHDNAGLQGVISGVSGLAGGFTALTGAISLFGAENEELIKIQTKLQSVMAITMGLQQMMDTLNKTSAFSVVTLTKAKQLLTTANYKLATALGISTAAATALMATLTLGLSLAITGIITLYNKYTSAQEEARQQALDNLEVEQEGRAEMLRTQMELDRVIKSLERYKGSKEEEQRKVAELNSKYGEAFGYYKSVAEWYDVLKQKSADYIQVMYLEAKARALVDRAIKADEEYNKAKTEEANAKPGLGDYIMSALAAGGGGYGGAITGGNKVSAETLAKDEYRQAKEEAEKRKNDALAEATKVQDEIAEIRAKSDIGGHEAPKVKATNTKAMSQLAEERRRLQEQLAESERKAQEAISELKVENMVEGYEKERKTAELQHKQEMERIKKEEEARLKLIATLRKKGVSLPQGKEMQTSALARSEEALQTAKYEEQIAKINKEEQEEKQKTLDELLNKYEDYSIRRKLIEKEYQDYLRDLEKERTATNGADIDAAKERASKERDKKLKAVDAEELEATEKTSAFLVELFEDASEKSTAAIKRILHESEDLINYLKTTASEDITSRNGISAQKLRHIKESPEEMQKLTEGVEKLKKSYQDRSPIAAFYAEVKKGIDLIKNSGKEGGKADIGLGLEKIGGAATKVLPQVKEIGQQIGNILGDSNISEDIGILTDSIAGIGTAAMGVGKIMSGDILGGIQGVLSGVGSIVSMASRAEAAHREALKKIQESALAFEREYNLVLLKQRLLMEEAVTPFSEDKIRKAVNALKVYADADASYRKQLKGQEQQRATGWAGVFFNREIDKINAAVKRGHGLLAQVKIVTGHEKTGLFGWGKGRDTYSSLLDVYPQLIDKQGNLNKEMLKTVMSTRSMSKEHKQMLEDLLAQQELMEQTQKDFDSYLTDTFGSLGSSMTSAITTSLREGGDALELFAKDASKVIENLGEQMIYSLFFADRFKQLKEQLESVYKSGKPQEQIAEEGRKTIANFYKGMSGEVAQAQEWAKAWKESATKEGFSVWGSQSASQSAKSGNAFTTMTQEQGTKLEGLFTSAQVHLANIDDHTINITARLSNVLDSLSQIAHNTKPIISIYEEIQTLKREGIKIK